MTISPGVIDNQEYRFAVQERRQVSISIKAMVAAEHQGDPDRNKAALAVFGFYNEDGEELLPVSEISTSPGIGPYIYLDTDAEGGETTLSITSPRNATSMHIKLRAWRRSIPVSLKDLVVEVNDEAATATLQAVTTLIDNLPPLSPIYIIYTTAPQMGHPAITLRSNRFAMGLAERGALVLFFPFGGVTPDNSNYSTGILQFKREELGDAIDALAASGRRNITFICSAFSDHQATCAIDLANLYGWKTLYECRDDMEEFRRSGYAKWHFPRLEMRAASEADHISAVSPRLQQKMRELTRDRDVHLIPNAVSEKFLSATDTHRTLKVLNGRAHSKIVGYIGHLTSSWFDWPLVIRSALQNPDLTYELIGFGQPSNLVYPENIKLLGPKTHDEFIEISKRWALGIIPFIPSKLTYGVDPNKLYEYMALALPVVSAPMGGVTESPLTDVYHRIDEYDGLIRKRIGREYGNEDITDLIVYLESCRWPQRISSTVSLLETTA